MIESPSETVVQRMPSLTIKDIFLFILLFITVYLLEGLVLKGLLLCINSLFLKLSPEDLKHYSEQLMINGYFVIARLSIFYCIILFVMHKFAKHRNLKLADAVALRPLHNYRIGFLIGITILLFIGKFILAIPLYYLFFLKDIDKTLISQVLHSGKGVILFCLFASFIGPFFEEMVFRGFLFNPIEKKWGYKSAIGIVTFLFILTHITTYWGYLASLIVITPISIVLAWVRAKRGSIIPGIILHVLYNFTSLVLFVLVKGIY